MPSGITVTRHLTIARDIYQAAEYPELRDLLYAALDDSRAVVVLERQTEAAR